MILSEVHRRREGLKFDEVTTGVSDIFLVRI